MKKHILRHSGAILGRFRQLFKQKEFNLLAKFFSTYTNSQAAPNANTISQGATFRCQMGWEIERRGNGNLAEKKSFR
jgi:hypothetical protein